MRATTGLRHEHAQILRQASLLNGLAAARMTREAAERARTAMLTLNATLVPHLEREDAWLYPALATATDPAVRSRAEDCIEDLGAILGAWNAYMDRWTIAAILVDPVRFKDATEGLIGALAIRVEMENGELYPLMDALASGAPVKGLAA